MLSGAYSNRFKTFERDQVEHLKAVKQAEKGDVIARSRRLTQETNKRRRAQAQKRKHERQKEEKRRQLILSKRREEQQRATEKYQRAHVPNSRVSSPTRTVTGLDEALKLIRGSPTLSRQSSLSPGGHMSRQSQHGYKTTYDPLSKPYFNKYSSRHMHLQSPSERAQEHAEMLDKSLRNYKDSRSLFEQQLQQHQQLLLEEQKKSLKHFNQAIQQEIDSDAKLEGTEELIEDSPWLTRSDSLSSVDSLEASQGSGGRDRPQTAKATSNTSLRSKSFPRPVQPKATPLVGRVAPNSASVTTSDSSESSSKQFQVDYASKTSISSHTNGGIIGPIYNNNRVTHQPFLLHSETKEDENVDDFHTTDTFTTQTYMYTAPVSSPIAAEQAWGPVITGTGQSVPQTFSLPSSVSGQVSSQSSSTSAGQAFTTQQKDDTRQTTVSTLSITAVSCSPSYTLEAASVVSTTLPKSTSAAVTSSVPPSTLTVSHKTCASNSPVNYLSSASKPTSAVTVEKTKAETTSTPASKASDKGSITNGTLGLMHGRLAVLADIEAVANSNKPHNRETQRKTLSQRSASVLEPREVKGILKRPEPCKLRKSMSTGNLQKAGLNVKDSIEIAREMRTEKENIRKKSGKKSVRFADLHYDEDIPEDNDSTDSNTDLAAPVKKVNINSNSTTQVSRQRPMSAKVSGSSRANASRIARATSAGSTRSGQPQHATDRPRAAAHIIAHSIEGNDYLSSNSDKNLHVVTNNFMGKVPSVSRAATSVSSQGVIHTVSNAYTDQNGDIQMTSSALQKAENATTTYQSKYVTAPVSSHHQPYDSSTQKKVQEVYNENGLRIDRTPTDDEINWLWEKVRTCLNREPTPTEKKTSASLAATDSNLLLSRQAAPVSNKYIDGASLGFSNNARTAPVMYGNTVQQRAMNNMSSRHKPTSANTGSYMRKYGLLQQRKQAGSAKGISTQKQQQQQLNPVASKFEPQESEASQLPRNDITESMATYLAAEHFAGGSLSESQVQLAMEEAHRRQMEIRSEGGYKTAAGPSALSLEELKLMESIDRLNQKLIITEAKQAANANKPPSASAQRYVQTGRFRGHQPISQTSQRGRAFSRSSRVQSARHYH